MAQTKKRAPAAEHADTPDWPTMIRSRLPDGRLLGTDNALWLYRAVPMAPVEEARSPEEGVATAVPLMMAMDELAAMTPVRMARRASSRGGYRQVHMLLVNLPQRFVPPAEHPIAEYLATSFPNTPIDRRVLLFGVRLIAKVGGEGGLRRAVDSIAETLAMGGTPLSDYDPDYREVSAALGRAGLSAPSGEELNLASAWWNEGNAPDVPLLAQVDCLHVFTATDAARAAFRAGPDGDFSQLGAGHHTITFAAVSDLDLPFVSPMDPRAHWASQLITQGALAISVRGKVEPTTVTRAELRRQRKRYIDDINERAAANKMDRAEQSEQEALLADVEAVYATGGPPTLTETSVVVGFNGYVPDMDDLSRDLTATLRPMWYHQRSAMAETMLCSPARANPYLQDLPTQSVAASGLPSLSSVGDLTGAMVGLTESDKQPSYLDPMAATDADTLPMALVAGATGSGKLLKLSTNVPVPVSPRFPRGWTTMGELEAGDVLFGRNGAPCRVTALSAIEEAPDLYRLTFSDGQTIDADSNHQWVVSTFGARNGVRKPRHLVAAETHQQVMVACEDLDRLARTFGPDDELTSAGLLEVVKAGAPGAPWVGRDGVVAAMRMLDVPSVLRDIERPVRHPNQTLLKSDPVWVFPVATTAVAVADKWEAMTAGNAARWGVRAQARAAAARTLASQTLPGLSETAPEIARQISQLAGGEPVDGPLLRNMARAAGITATRARRTVQIAVPAEHTALKSTAHYPAAIALKALAERLRQRYADAPALEAGEVVMSTGELLDAGVRTHGGQARFATRVAAPLDLPDADLPVAPYTLGAWLGDGSSRSAQITSMDPEIIAAVVADGYPVRRVVTTPRSRASDFHLAFELDRALGAAGFLMRRTVTGQSNKHIPAVYLRASRAQRLAVLQGLMDTDGTISKAGTCELALCAEQLARDALELVRSLGIRASITSGPAALTEADPDRPGFSRRRVVGTRYRVKFTTTEPVFRLARKAVRLPVTLRETSGWNYITDITAVDPVPARCLTVDSVDSTYLVEGFVPTHNTLLMLWLADQYARSGNKALGTTQTPVIIIDPKAVTLDTRIPIPGGWTTMEQVAVGDTVFGRDGKPCNVVRKSRVFTETHLFEFVMDDGQVIRADNNHQWVVASQRDRVAMTADPAGKHWRTVTTEQILDEGVMRGRQTNFALPVAQAVEFPEADLSIAPYLLGAWLGDGTSKGGDIASGYEDADEMTAILAGYWPNINTRDDRSCRMITLGKAASTCKRGHPAANFSVRARTLPAPKATQMYCNTCNRTVGGEVVNPSLHHLLVDERLIGNKHIPAAYLRGSVEQRMELLRGLMDTDGTVKRSGACRFSGMNHALVVGVLELVRSLGFKAMLHTSVAAITEPDPERPGSSTRRAIGPVFEVTFRTHLPVFKLARKLALLPAVTPTRATFHYIKAVNPIASEAAQCIGVDSPDHTFLVAEFIPTHNTDSDHSAAVLASGGQVASLDDLASADGIFDPIRFSAKPEVGVELAASMLMSINPWGTKASDFEAPLQYALSYGVSHGATCVGQALHVAKMAGHAPPEMVDAAFRLAQSSAMFRACFGINPTSDGLRVADGITLIKVGDAHLDLPAPGAVNPPLGQRIALALVRMMVFGSAMALTGRDGVVMLDEAWVFLSAGRQEMERLGRLARSQRVFPIMFTQRVTDAVEAGLTGYISRGLIGPIQERTEAIAACELFKLAPTEERLARITASATIGSGGSTAHNWNSMRALVTSGTPRVVHRGSVWIYCDISGRAVPVEVTVPPAFLDRASTNAAEIRRRTPRPVALTEPSPQFEAPQTVATQASMAFDFDGPAPYARVAEPTSPVAPYAPFMEPVVPAAPYAQPVGFSVPPPAAAQLSWPAERPEGGFRHSA
jgi:hypothetical protein